MVYGNLQVYYLPLRTFTCSKQQGTKVYHVHMHINMLEYKMNSNKMLSTNTVFIMINN